MVTVLMESHKRVIAEQREYLRKICEDLNRLGGD
jgi:hypothetical protein